MIVSTLLLVDDIKDRLELGQDIIQIAKELKLSEKVVEDFIEAYLN